MKTFDKWAMPDDEKHLPEWMTKVNRRVAGRLTYQYGKYDAALPHCREKRIAIDVGAHIGLWSYFMAQDFEQAICFEPMEEHADCWCVNMDGVKNAELWPWALGEKEGFVILETRTPGSSGDTQVRISGTQPVGENPGSVPMKPLDFFKLEFVDLIKIDCEGFEEFVLRGARDTLERCKPCVIVEQKGDMSRRYGLQKQSAVQFLKDMGAEVRAEISGDFILSWA